MALYYLPLHSLFLLNPDKPKLQLVVTGRHLIQTSTPSTNGLNESVRSNTPISSESLDSRMSVIRGKRRTLSGKYAARLSQHKADRPRTVPFMFPRMNGDGKGGKPSGRCVGDCLENDCVMELGANASGDMTYPSMPFDTLFNNRKVELAERKPGRSNGEGRSKVGPRQKCSYFFAEHQHAYSDPKETQQQKPFPFQEAPLDTRPLKRDVKRNNFVSDEGSKAVKEFDDEPRDHLANGGENMQSYFTVNRIDVSGGHTCRLVSDQCSPEEPDILNLPQRFPPLYQKHSHTISGKSADILTSKCPLIKNHEMAIGANALGAISNTSSLDVIGVTDVFGPLDSIHFSEGVCPFQRDSHSSVIGHSSDESVRDKKRMEDIIVTNRKTSTNINPLCSESSSEHNSANIINPLSECSSCHELRITESFNSQSTDGNLLNSKPSKSGLLTTRVLLEQAVELSTILSNIKSLAGHFLMKRKLSKGKRLNGRVLMNTELSNRGLLTKQDLMNKGLSDSCPLTEQVLTHTELSNSCPLTENVLTNIELFNRCLLTRRQCINTEAARMPLSKRNLISIEASNSRPTNEQNLIKSEPLDSRFLTEHYLFNTKPTNCGLVSRQDSTNTKQCNSGQSNEQNQLITEPFNSLQPTGQDSIITESSSRKSLTAQDLIITENSISNSSNGPSVIKIDPFNSRLSTEQSPNNLQPAKRGPSNRERPVNTEPSNNTTLMALYMMNSELCNKGSSNAQNPINTEPSLSLPLMGPDLTCTKSPHSGPLKRHNPINTEPSSYGPSKGHKSVINETFCGRLPNRRIMMNFKQSNRGPLNRQNWISTQPSNCGYLIRQNFINAEPSNFRSFTGQHSIVIKLSNGCPSTAQDSIITESSNSRVSARQKLLNIHPSNGQDLTNTDPSNSFPLNCGLTIKEKVFLSSEEDTLMQNAKLKLKLKLTKSLITEENHNGKNVSYLEKAECQSISSPEKRPGVSSSLEADKQMKPLSATMMKRYYQSVLETSGCKFNQVRQLLAGARFCDYDKFCHSKYVQQPKRGVHLFQD